MRSVVVVFPASMWAMMPMFRILSSAVVRGIAFLYSAKTRGDQDARVGRSRSAVIGRLSASSMQDPLRQGPEIVCLRFSRGAACCARTFSLPPVMRESPIGFRHPVRVFLLLYRLAFALRRQDQLGGEALGPRLLFARAAVLYDPAHAQRRAPLRPHFYRHLIRRAADAPGFHFQRRF